MDAMRTCVRLRVRWVRQNEDRPKSENQPRIIAHLTSNERDEDLLIDGGCL
jgi:hypothetical protein